MNSMWSSAANALGMSRAALGNLDAQRFITGPENNYWVKGMGDFLNHASEGVRTDLTTTAAAIPWERTGESLPTLPGPGLRRPVRQDARAQLCGRY